MYYHAPTILNLGPSSPWLRLSYITYLHNHDEGIRAQHKQPHHLEQKGMNPNPNWESIKKVSQQEIGCQVKHITKRASATH